MARTDSPDGPTPNTTLGAAGAGPTATPSRLARVLRSMIPPRLTLFIRTLPYVFGIVTAKLVVDQLGWEFIVVGPLHASIIAGAIFIVGLMLAGTMGDYKECERLPTETAAAMESIYREGAYVKELHPSFDLARLADTLARVPHTLHTDLIDGSRTTIAVVEQLTESFLEMDRLGVPPNYIARLKQEQALIVRNLMRVAYIQRIAFLPSAHALVEIMLTLLIILLIFTQAATRATDAILIGFISLIFIYILHLLRVLDSPFQSARSGLDDVSLYQIDAIHDAMHQRIPGPERARHDDA